MRQYVIYEPVKTLRVTTVNAPDNLSKEEVYSHYSEALEDIDIMDSTIDMQSEELCENYYVEENK